MTDDDNRLDAGGMPVERLVELYARQKALREEFTDQQLAALDALWRAKRDGHVPPDAANVIERLIRDGHVHGALKRLTIARRKGITSGARSNGTDGSGRGSHHD